MADFNRFITAGEVIRRVLAVQGLPRIENVSSSTDATARQMWALLTECGQDLLEEADWVNFVKTHSITTGAGTEYDLPVDLLRYVDETGWNNTSRFPLIGPVGRQVWRMLQARQLGGTTLRIQYTIEGNKIKLYFAPTPAQTLNIDYISRGWVQDATNPLVRRDYPAADADIILYQPRLIITALRLKWRDTKGFDTTSAMIEYGRALHAAKGNDRPASDLNLATRPSGNLISTRNLSDTGYGS
jgi:hypothetical protein